MKGLFEGEVLFRTLPTPLLQVLFKVILNSGVTIESILDPDDNVKIKSKRRWLTWED